MSSPCGYSLRSAFSQQHRSVNITVVAVGGSRAAQPLSRIYTLCAQWDMAGLPAQQTCWSCRPQMLLQSILLGLKHRAMLTVDAVLMVIIHLWPGLSLVLPEPPRPSSSAASPAVLGLCGWGCHRRLAGTPLQHKGAAAHCRSVDDARGSVTGWLPASSSL